MVLTKKQKLILDYITRFLDEKGYSPDQIRYYLALMSLPEKPANFDFTIKDVDGNKFVLSTP